MTFKFKRAHWSAVGFGKRALEGIAHMTPARFDLLYVIRRNHSFRGAAWWFIEQCKLRAMLGVHHSTVSKMLKRLVVLEWVTVEEHPTNRRTNIVRLTRAGFDAIELAIRATMKRRVHRYFFYNLFKLNRRGVKIKVAIYHYVMQLAWMAEEMGDRARLEYPMLFDPDI